MPKISVSKTVKVGVGRFESVDVSASIEYEYDPSKKVTDEAYAWGWKVVDIQLNKQIQELQDIAKPDSVFLSEKPQTTKKRN